MTTIDWEESFERRRLMDFGEYVLRQKRKELELTQEQMAKKIGIHRSRISRIERGLGKPKGHNVEKVVRYYELGPIEASIYRQLVSGITMPNLTPIPHHKDAILYWFSVLSDIILTLYDVAFSHLVEDPVENEKNRSNFKQFAESRIAQSLIKNISATQYKN